MTDALKKLSYYEQKVNNRFGTSPGTSVPDFMRPENEHVHQLAWCRVPLDSAEVFAELPFTKAEIIEDLSVDGQLLYPVHPLEEEELNPDRLVRSGHIRFSASYRTVFYTPEPGGPLAAIQRPGQCTMLKLNLQKAIPGIPGDRRLRRDAVNRCVLLGRILDAELSRLCPDSSLQVVTEPVGIFANDAGTLVRQLPEVGMVPLFSLYSEDHQHDEELSLLDVEMRNRYGTNSSECAARFGEDIGRPLAKALIDGFRCGFSLEMHAQNTLVKIGDERLIGTVCFRDLEGALVSNTLRGDLRLEPVTLPGENVFGEHDDFPLGYFFNRNLDHDIGRVFRGCLRALRKSGYFADKQTQMARQSIRRAVKEELAGADLPIAQANARLMPFSRAPWGSGLRPGHWFRTEFR